MISGMTFERDGPPYSHVVLFFQSQVGGILQTHCALKDFSYIRTFLKELER